MGSRKTQEWGMMRWWSVWWKWWCSAGDTGGLHIGANLTVANTNFCNGHQLVARPGSQFLPDFQIVGLVSSTDANFCCKHHFFFNGHQLVRCVGLGANSSPSLFADSKLSQCWLLLNSHLSVQKFQPCFDIFLQVKHQMSHFIGVLYKLLKRKCFFLLRVSDKVSWLFLRDYNPQITFTVWNVFCTR